MSEINNDCGKSSASKQRWMMMYVAVCRRKGFGEILVVFVAFYCILFVHMSFVKHYYLSSSVFTK